MPPCIYLPSAVWGILKSEALHWFFCVSLWVQAGKLKWSQPGSAGWGQGQTCREKLIFQLLVDGLIFFSNFVCFLSLWLVATFFLKMPISSMVTFIQSNLIGILVFSQHTWIWGSKRSLLWLLVIVADFLKITYFFYFCKKFKTVEKEERNKDLFLLAKYLLLFWWFLSLPPKTFYAHLCAYTPFP